MDNPVLQRLVTRVDASRLTFRHNDDYIQQLSEKQMFDLLEFISGMNTNEYIGIEYDIHSTYDSYSSNYVEEITFHKYRDIPESDEQYKARLEQHIAQKQHEKDIQERQAKRVAEQEYQQYLALKKKFDK